MKLRSELRDVRAVLFDLDGTLYQGGAPIADSVSTVRAVRDAGLAVRFLTNTTSQSRRCIARKLARLGFTAAEEEIHSPPAAAGRWLREQRASAALFVQEAARADFAGVAIDPHHPDFVVVGDLAADWTFTILNDAFRLLLERGAALLALGRTRYWQTEVGLQLDAGPFVAALEYATEQRARVFGKPAKEFFRSALAGLDCRPAQAVVVGDDIRTDVGAAMDAGLRGVLVRTGKFRPADLATRVEPALVLGSVAELLA